MIFQDLLAVGSARSLSRQRIDLRAWLLRQEPLLRAAVGSSAHFELIAGDAEVWVDADADALSRVLLNLVKNAGEALVGQGAVTVGYTDNVFSVADDATDPPHASDWFFRLRAGVAAHFVGRRQYALVEYMAEGERYQTQTNEILWVHRASGVLSRILVAP